MSESGSSCSRGRTLYHRALGALQTLGVVEGPDPSGIKKLRRPISPQQEPSKTRRAAPFHPSQVQHPRRVAFSPPQKKKKTYQQLLAGILRGSAASLEKHGKEEEKKRLTRAGIHFTADWINDIETLSGTYGLNLTKKCFRPFSFGCEANPCCYSSNWNGASARCFVAVRHGSLHPRTGEEDVLNMSAHVSSRSHK